MESLSKGTKGIFLAGWIGIVFFYGSVVQKLLLILAMEIKHNLRRSEILALKYFAKTLAGRKKLFYNRFWSPIIFVLLIYSAGIGEFTYEYIRPLRLIASHWSIWSKFISVSNWHYPVVFKMVYWCDYARRREFNYWGRDCFKQWQYVFLVDAYITNLESAICILCIFSLSRI